MVKFFLLGTPYIKINGQDANLGMRKDLALVAYLAIEGQAQSRDFLAALLWPEKNQSRARANLRRSLYRLKKILGENFLKITAENVAIDSEVGLWLDAVEFQRTLAERLSEELPLESLSDEHWAHLQAACDLYGGDFMEGFALPDSAAFDEWQFFKREALKRKLAGALKQLAQFANRQGNPQDGIEHARRWLALDPLHEPAHLLLMELYARTGQQSAALRQYQECCRLLEETLDISPEPQTTELFEAIRARKELRPVPLVFEPPEVRYALSDQVHIAYQVLGSGPLDVLVISGFVSHLDQIWKEPGLAAMLRRLAQSCRLILFDKRGVGLSDRVGYPPTLENTVDDVRAVMQAAGSEQAVFFGFSEGGPASLLFSATYPERTLGLILYGTMAKGKSAPDYSWALSEEEYSHWLAWLQETWGKPVAHAYFAPSHPAGDPLWEWFASLLRLGSTPGEVQRVLEVTKEIDVRPILPAIRVPTLILHRSGDRTIYVQSGRYLAEHIPQASFVELPGDDHWFWLGDAEQVLKEMGDFIGGLKPAPVQDRALATILGMQIVPDPGATGAQLGWPEAVIRLQVERYRGRLRGSDPDLRLATFDGPSRALQCARALSRTFQRRGLPVRIALHSGECLISGDELGGPAVEIVRAVISESKKGEVLLTHTVKDLVVGAGFEFSSAGDLQLANDLGAWRLYQFRTV